MKRTAVLFATHAALLATGIFGTICFYALSAWSGGRVVQVLEDAAGRHEAVLTRRDSFLDLNFIVTLDGRRLYVSPDFYTNRAKVQRETLLWDASGKVLIFQVLDGRRLFAYDVQAHRKLSAKETQTLKASDLPLRDYGFEAEWPPATPIRTSPAAP